jgi:drug/metabolite transporter (DMT)-like permease
MNEPQITNHQPQTRFRAHLAVLLTNLFFAGNYSLVKLTRVAMSLLLFWIVWLFGKTGAGIDRKDWGRFVLCALTGIAVNQMLFIKGLTMTSTVHASLLSLVTPIVVTLFALWVLKERFTIYKAAGLSLGIGGATFLILQRESSNQATDYLLGDVLIVLNAISYSLYFVILPCMSSAGCLRWAS